ncbi:hypothetical protein ACVOMV_03545 [Mesorhizobium atlanticum]|jgi:hypothetical protein
MSTRGANFLDRWMAEHLPEVVTDDTAAISDLTDQVMEAADREGIEVSEIYEEVGSVFEAIAVAMQHRDGSLPDNDFNEFDLLAGRLSREANLTEAQARDLIERFGTDWEKLLNEAHFLKELEGRLGNKSLIGAATLCRNEDRHGQGISVFRKHARRQACGRHGLVGPLLRLPASCGP